ncbi:MAG TPA: cell division protein SepF [Actinomycetota bacterium]|jgi:cell division inhibitor SepF|nr:cell division protein SepF [Actinomycetota bacterium]
MAGVWRKTLVYLGLVEDEEYDDYGYEDLEMDEAQPRRPAPRGRGEAADGGGQQREAVVRAMPSAAPQARFHLVMPSSFNDAQEVGDKFREGYSVLMNLQGVDPDLARRLVDFASGLAYGLAGSMQPVAEKVFLITPAGIQVSAEERRRFLEERGFFNQA